MILALCLAAIIAYLLGSVSPSYLMGKLKGTDLRQHGSGNLGFSNAWRVLGKGPSVVVLLLDILKGFLAVWVGKMLAIYFGLTGEPLVVVEIVTGFAVILGHIYTCFLGFKGGKGVATGLGVFIFLAPSAVAGAFGVFLIAVASSRYISLGSILAALSLPIFLLVDKFCFSSCCTPGPSWWIVLLAVVIAIVVVVKHLANIKRLLAGTENKFSWSKN